MALETAGCPIFKCLAAVENDPASTTRMKVSMTAKRSILILLPCGDEMAAKVFGTFPAAFWAKSSAVAPVADSMAGVTVRDKMTLPDRAGWGMTHSRAVILSNQ
jgi:hypothetical protein